jgi:ferric-dicitrate binding protein FerR (iron transport regulator)
VDPTYKGNRWSATVNSPEIVSEATKWVVELETTDRFDDVWSDFDDWFESSAAHREAYIRARQTWIRVAKVATLPMPDPSSPGPLFQAHGFCRFFASEWISHLRAFLAD